MLDPHPNSDATVCPRCRRDLAAVHRFCPFCGTLVEAGTSLEHFGAEIRWLESFTDTTRDAVIISDESGVVVMANEVALAVLDLEAVASTDDGRPNLSLLLRSVVGPSVLDAIQTALDRRQPWRGAVPLPFLSGESVPVDAVVLPVSGADGEALGAAMVLRDLLAIADAVYSGADDRTSDGIDDRVEPVAAPVPATPAPVDHDAPADLGSAAQRDAVMAVLDALATEDDDLPATLAGALHVGATLDEVIGAVLAGDGVLRLADLLEPLDDLPVVLRLVRLDGLVRSGRTSVAEVHVAYQLLTDADPGPLHQWVAALAAEYHLWQGELTGLLVAEAALRGHRSDGSVVGTIAAARLRRLVALVDFIGAPDRASVDELRPTIEAFRSVGADEEAALTVVLAALAVSIFRDASVLRSLEPELVGAVAALEAAGASRLRVALVGLAWIGSAYPDDVVMRDALGRYHAAFEGVAGWPILDGMVRYLDVIADIVADPERAEAPDARDRLIASVQGLREMFLPATGAQMLAVMLLLDLGWVDEADRLLAGVDVSLLYSPHVVEDRDSRLLRLDILRGRPGAREAAVEHALAVVASQPPYRMGAYLLLRVARDLERIGRADDAAPLRAEGAALLTTALDGAAPTAFDAYLLRPVTAGSPTTGREPTATATAPAPSAAPMTGAGTGAGTGGSPATVDPVGSMLRVLTPDVEVWRHGVRVEVTPIQAHMLVTLAAARGPVSTDWFIERVWPEVDAAVGRNRLKAQVHKLRRVLDIGSSELVVRTAAGLELEEADGWTVDLWDLARLTADGAPPAADAAVVTGFVPVLCDRQFPFDDEVAIARSFVLHRWTAAAHRVLDRAEMDPVAVAHRVIEAGVADVGLAERLEEVLVADRDRSTVEALRALVWA